MTLSHEEQLWAATADNMELKSQISALEGRLSDNARKHANDIKLIGEALISEANERDWCAEFDQWVDALNPTLNIELPLRVSDYTTEITITVDFSSSPDDAEFVAADIAQALYSDGDNLGSHEYTINRSECTSVEQV
jgi:hypothetical protein